MGTFVFTKVKKIVAKGLRGAVTPVVGPWRQLVEGADKKTRNNFTF